jgi:hypothetical protein
MNTPRIENLRSCVAKLTARIKEAKELCLFTLADDLRNERKALESTLKKEIRASGRKAKSSLP